MVTLTGADTDDQMTVYNYLLDCNVLFCNEDDKLVPQNQLMRNAIIKVLDNEEM